VEVLIKLFQTAPGGAAKTLRGTLSVVLASFYKSLPKLLLGCGANTFVGNPKAERVGF
jgi:hypothetical protein